MLHAAHVYFQDPQHVAMVCGYAALVASEILPFTKGKANGLLQGLISILTKVKAQEEAKK